MTNNQKKSNKIITFEEKLEIIFCLLSKKNRLENSIKNLSELELKTVSKKIIDKNNKISLKEIKKIDKILSKLKNANHLIISTEEFIE